MKFDWPSSFSISFRENNEVMFSDDVDKTGFTVGEVPEEHATAIIRIVCKRYKEDKSRLDCCDHDEKQGEQ